MQIRTNTKGETKLELTRLEARQLLAAAVELLEASLGASVD